MNGYRTEIAFTITAAMGYDRKADCFHGEVLFLRFVKG